MTEVLTQDMPSIQITTHTHWGIDFNRYAFIRDCPKDVKMSEAGYNVSINGTHYDNLRHKELDHWIHNPASSMSLDLCRFFYNTIGFVPFVAIHEGEMFYDPPDAIITHKRPVMAEIMGIRLPKALIKEIRLVQDNVEDLGDVFKFELDKSYFPKELRKHVKPALQALLTNNTTTYVRHLYIYEMLGISLTGSSFISGEDLFSLTVENLKKTGEFSNWCTGKCTVIKMPVFPIDKRDTLTVDDVEYITDMMIERYWLYIFKCDIKSKCDWWKLPPPPSPFESRIRAYLERKK
jgi:hypothetical protein